MNSAKQRQQLSSTRAKLPRADLKAQDTEVNANEEDAAQTVEGEEELIADEVEESRSLPNPVLPDQATIDRHWIDHFPFRSWCGACIGGRGRASPHLRTDGKRKIPTLAFDYCFISKTGVYSREEWTALKASAAEEPEGVKIIVARKMCHDAPSLMLCSTRVSTTMATR